MVFFTCNACGESLKKANVEKHYLTKCRACEVLSCLDCGKDFHGDAYKEHTSCISEDQKYGGKNFKATPHKGAVKQNSWIETVREASMNASLNPKVRNTMKNIINCGQANVPRKKAKFMNFVRNSMHVRETWLIEQVWDTIEKYAAAQRAESTQPSATNNGELNGEAKVDDGESKTTKRGDEEHKTTVEDINDKRAQGGGKRKRQGDPLDEVNGDGEDGLEEQPRKKKKKKKKNREDDDDGNRGEDEQTANGLTEEDVDAFQQQSKQNGISEELEGKKKRKGKRRREREVNGDEDESLKTKEVKGNQTESDCKSRKRKDKMNNDQSLKGKKRKKDERENGVEEAAEEEEDAADDDDVTEQSRRDGESPQNIKCFIEPGGKFKWEAVITEVLQQAGGEIKIKKLKKKVLSEYFAHGEDASITSEEKLFTKFNKKVMKNPKLKVHKEMVQLKH